MQIRKTAKIKLEAKVDDFLPTAKAYTEAFNFVCQVGYEKSEHNSINLHKLTYAQAKAKFGLNSQLTCSARVKAAEALSSVKKKKYSKCPRSKLTSIRLDVRSYAISKDNVASISTLEGRKKFNLKIPDYYKDLFETWKRTSADLVISKNRVYLHISFEKDVEDHKPRINSKTLGIDRGINKIAVTSDNKFYSANKLKLVCKRYQQLRRRLQKADTQSAKRHLKKLSGKEKRFKADVNHQISKKIINSLNSGDTIALERLKGIRDKKVGKKLRTALNSWNFYQLQQFLTYKALAKGIKVVYVNAAYTSTTCSECGYNHKSNRKNQSTFQCTNPEFGKCRKIKLNADLNASRNISSRALSGYKPDNGADVNQPCVAVEISATSPRL
jgi:IS605 OrfB family transposase